MAITTVLLDLDGVIRHLDPAHLSEVEAQHDLAPGSLMAAAFHPSRLEPAITGAVSRAEWVHQIGEAINNHTAAQAWLSERGSIDAAMLALVAQLRATGITVAVLTNGTDTVPDEMEHFGIADSFDAVFSTWHIGYAKPDIRAFSHVCEALGVEPHEVFFTDDSEAKLAGARELGMKIRHFTGVSDFRSHLDSLGIEV